MNFIFWNSVRDRSPFFPLSNVITVWDVASVNMSWLIICEKRGAGVLHLGFLDLTVVSKNIADYFKSMV